MASRLSRFKRLIFGAPLATHSSAGWVYPLPPLTRLTRALRVGVGGAALLGAILGLVVAVLWGVPSLLAATSPAYALAKERAGKDRELPSYLGSPVECEWIPSHYRLDEGAFRFWARGPRGSALVTARIEGEQVTRFSLIRIRFGE